MSYDVDPLRNGAIFNVLDTTMMKSPVPRIIRSGERIGSTTGPIKPLPVHAHSNSLEHKPMNIFTLPVTNSNIHINGGASSMNEYTLPTSNSSNTSSIGRSEQFIKQQDRFNMPIITNSPNPLIHLKKNTSTVMGAMNNVNITTNITNNTTDHHTASPIVNPNSATNTSSPNNKRNILNIIENEGKLVSSKFEKLYIESPMPKVVRQQIHFKSSPNSISPTESTSPTSSVITPQGSSVQSQISPSSAQINDVNLTPIYSRSKFGASNHLRTSPSSSSSTSPATLHYSPHSTHYHPRGYTQNVHQSRQFHQSQPQPQHYYHHQQQEGEGGNNDDGGVNDNDDDAYAEENFINQNYAETEGSGSFDNNNHHQLFGYENDEFYINNIGVDGSNERGEEEIGTTEGGDGQIFREYEYTNQTSMEDDQNRRNFNVGYAYTEMNGDNDEEGVNDGGNDNEKTNVNGGGEEDEDDNLNVDEFVSFVDDEEKLQHGGGGDDDQSGGKKEEEERIAIEDGIMSPILENEKIVHHQHHPAFASSDSPRNFLDYRKTHKHQTSTSRNNNNNSQRRGRKPRRRSDDDDSNDDDYNDDDDESEEDNNNNTKTLQRSQYSTSLHYHHPNKKRTSPILTNPKTKSSSSSKKRFTAPRKLSVNNKTNQKSKNKQTSSEEEETSGGDDDDENEDDEYSSDARPPPKKKGAALVNQPKQSVLEMFSKNQVVKVKTEDQQQQQQQHTQKQRKPIQPIMSPPSMMSSDSEYDDDGAGDASSSSSSSSSVTSSPVRKSSSSTSRRGRKPRAEQKQRGRPRGRPRNQHQQPRQRSPVVKKDKRPKLIEKYDDDSDTPAKRSRRKRSSVKAWWIVDADDSPSSKIQDAALQSIVNFKKRKSLEGPTSTDTTPKKRKLKKNSSLPSMSIQTNFDEKQRSEDLADFEFSD